MSPSTSLLCSACGSPRLPEELQCPRCGAPVSAVGAEVAHDGGDNPVVVAHSGFSWDAVTQRLRDLTIGKYEILTVLGRGGMAAVFLAREYALHRHVALKVMSPGIMMTEGMIDRFHNEAVMQANLSHANIVGVHAVRHEADLHYFSMQYVPGRSLQQVISAAREAERPLSIDVVRSLLYQIGSALSYAHRRGVIHRDIKPANVLLNLDGQAIVTDFGIAKVASAPSQTLTGTVVGTAPYMSPEQCYALDLTNASDQYSLGVVAFELLTGRPPFSGASFAVMQEHTLSAPPPLRDLRPDCPADLEAAVLKMLAKNPTERFADINAALVGLNAHPAATSPEDPVHQDLVRLADVPGVEASLADVLRIPVSPIPRSTRSSDLEKVALPSAKAPRRSPTPAVPPEHQTDAPPPQPPRLHLAEAPARVEVGERITIAATASDQTDAAVPHLTLRWSSSNTQVASVQSESGEIEALSEGTTDIVATAGDAVAIVHLTVVDASVATIVGVGVRGPVEVGESFTVPVQTLDARSVARHRDVRWSVRGDLVPDGSAPGTFVGRSAGTATVIAMSGAVRSEFEVRVVPPAVAELAFLDPVDVVGVGETVSARVVLRDRRGQELAARPVAWSTSAANVLAVSDAGLLTGVAEGSATLEVRCEGVSIGMSVIVGAVSIAELKVVGIATLFKSGATARVRVVTKDTSGRVRRLPVQWVSSNERVAFVDDSSTLRTPMPGTATLHLKCGTAEREFSIEVRDQVPLLFRARQTWNETPKHVALWVGGAGIALVLILLATRADDGERAPAPASGSVASATNPPVIVPASLSIVGLDSALEVGDTVSLSVVAGPANVAAGAPLHWSSRDSSIATVDPARGMLTAVSMGEVQISVSDGVSYDTLVVTVRAPIWTGLRLNVTRNPQTNQTFPLSATATSARGRSIRPPRREVAWSSSDTRIFSIDSSRWRMQTHAAGRAYLRAEWSGVRDSALITVQADAPSAVAPPVVAATPVPPTAPDPAPLSAASSWARECAAVYQRIDTDSMQVLTRGGTPDEARNLQALIGQHASAPLNGITLLNESAPIGEGNAATVTFTLTAIRKGRLRILNTGKWTVTLTLRAHLLRESSGWRLLSCRLESLIG